MTDKAAEAIKPIKAFIVAQARKHNLPLVGKFYRNLRAQQIQYKFSFGCTGLRYSAQVSAIAQAVRRKFKVAARGEDGWTGQSQGCDIPVKVIRVYFPRHEGAVK